MSKKISIAIRGLAVVLVLLVALFAVNKAYASSLDWTWGHVPSSLKIEGTVNLDENAQLAEGDWFSITYKIVVKKWAWESEDTVKDRIKEHFQKILGQTIYEHPELRIYYAEYRYTGKEWKGLYDDYHYDVIIIGRVEPMKLQGSTTTTRLVAWVPVAIIIGLIVAAIIATIVLVQQPAVQKLITSVGETIHESSKAMPIFFIGLGFFLLAIPILIIVSIAKKF